MERVDPKKFSSYRQILKLGLQNRLVSYDKFVYQFSEHSEEDEEVSIKYI